MSNNPSDAAATGSVPSAPPPPDYDQLVMTSSVAAYPPPYAAQDPMPSYMSHQSAGASAQFGPGAETPHVVTGVQSPLPSTSLKTPIPMTVQQHLPYGQALPEAGATGILVTTEDGQRVLLLQAPQLPPPPRPPSYGWHIALACCVTWCACWPLGLIAFILAMCASKTSKSRSANMEKATRLAIASLSVSAAGIVIAIIFIIVQVVLRNT